VEEIRTALSAAFSQAGAELQAEHLPFVFTDRQALGLVFQNLISNAVKFRGSLPPKIMVTASQSADQTFFCVRDNGIGIESDSQEKIFQLFGRSRQHGEFPGTGIGLAMCKRLVEGLGGQIWVFSKPGEGAAFHFSLPNRKSIIDFQKSFPT